MLFPQDIVATPQVAKHSVFAGSIIAKILLLRRCDNMCEYKIWAQTCIFGRTLETPGNLTTIYSSICVNEKNEMSEVNILHAKKNKPQ